MVKYVVGLCRVCDECSYYRKYECFVKQMLYVCVLCASCADLNAAFCITARGNHMEEGYSRAGPMTSL